MAVGAVIALALLELEHQDLLALELLEDLCSDLLGLEGSGVDDGRLAVVEHEDVEFDLIARLRVELLHGDDIALGNLILLATSCYDCVHDMPFIAGISATDDIVSTILQLVNEFRQ